MAGQSPVTVNGVELSADAQIIISYIQDEFSKFRTEFMEDLKRKDQQVQSLTSEVGVLKKKVEKLENLLDESDAYERRDTLIFSGPAVPAVSRDENCSKIVQELVKNELRCIIGENDISVAHRLGRQPASQGPDTRSIIAKFIRRDTKRDIFMASKKQTRPSRVFANESLTPVRRTIFKTLRVIKQAHPNIVTGCSTFEGRVYAYTKPDTAAARDKRHLISNHEMLETFCRDVVKKPLSSFLDSWPQ